MTHTLSPEDTDSRLERPRRLLADDPTNVIRPYQGNWRPMRRPDVDEELWTTARTYVPATIGDLDMAAAQPIAPLERVAGAEETAVVTLLGALGGEQPRARRSVPAAQLLSGRPEWTGPKHRRPSWLAVAWARVWGAM